MVDGKFIRTRFEWLDLLAAKSPVVARLDLKGAASNETYKAEGEKACDNKDAFNFASSEHHNAVIAQTIEQLSLRGASDETIRKLVLDLTSRNTYGTFCELSAYAFLLEGNHDFNIQAPVTGADILNPNGSDLDGLLRLPPEEAFFDIKAFGFHEHLVTLLTERLSAEFDPEVVEADESWDVRVSLLFDLLGRNYSVLKEELRANRQAKRGAIRFVLRAPARVRMTVRELDLARLAEENPDYAFRFAKQFARNKPFFLFFVIHPWLSGLSLHLNFGGGVDTFTRSFAHRTFTQFQADQTAVFDVTRGEASRLLSGIVFVDAWAGQPQNPPPRHRCFLNPFAKNKLARSSIEAFARPYGDAIAVVEF